LDEIRSKHKNEWAETPGNANLVSITTSPKLGIGQRAILVKTGAGNVLWDCITLIDDETIAKIKEVGGLKAIVISHPHYYSTHVEWARAFNCPVYIAAEDKEWTTQTSSHQVFVTKTESELAFDGADSGVKILKLGGHFPGSLVALYEKCLLVADTLMTTPAGVGNWRINAVGKPRSRPRGLNSFSFMWSIPNYIPLGPDDITRMWGILKKYDFQSTHGAFVGMDILASEAEMKERVLESMQIQIRSSGHSDHSFLKESLA
jgi:hypothetical protein